jgi:NTE family protein
MGQRVGLVLGAGGITGIAWLVGALEALQERTGWNPRTADVISGTSAGSVVAAVLASGAPLRDLLVHAEDQGALDAAIGRATAGRAHQSPGPAWPGSILLGATGLLATSPRHRLSSLAGFLPRGPRRTDEIRGLVHDAVADGWPGAPELWLHACDYASGRRVTCGRAGAPPADLADAVVASCAVPGYYHPVRIGGRRYVDGGLWSFTNADALAGAGCDVVLCLTPFATTALGGGPVLDTALFGAARGATALQRRREVRVLERAGAQVAVVEPCGEDLAAMGLNPMDRGRSRRTIETAARTVGARLPELLDGIALPPGATGLHAAA